MKSPKIDVSACSLGEVIRERRKEIGLKVYELADKVGVNPVYITQIEKHNKVPSEAVITEIGKVLKKDFSRYFQYQRLLKIYARTIRRKAQLDKELLKADKLIKAQFPGFRSLLPHP